MERKKLGVLLVAFVAGVVLLAGSASADVSGGVKGYILGDPAHGKLVPFYRVGTGLATLIGIESEQHEPIFSPIDGVSVIHGDILVHVTIFTKRSVEIQNFDLCLSPFDFGFLVLQNGPINSVQFDELFGDPHNPARNRFHKARVLSLADLGGNTEGYVTIATGDEFFSVDGTCTGALPISFTDLDVHLATWAILADVSRDAFFATEIPTPTAVVDPFTGGVSGLRKVDGVVVEASLGLIPGPTPTVFGILPLGNTPLFDNVCLQTHTGFCRPLDLVTGQNRVWGGNEVMARFDVNPVVNSKTEIFVWLKRNASVLRAGTVPGFLECEDELQISVLVNLPDEVNIIDPDKFAGIGQCKTLKQYRGVLEFLLPDTGFLWSHITQQSAHFRQNYIGYNKDNNGFVDCADDFDDFGESSDGLCGGD